jgi:CRP-like cAMP-binding protein
MGRLEDLDVFKGCDPAFLAQISDALETRAYLPEQAIVTEGEEGESMFILQQGHAFAFAGGNKVGELSTGSVFGEMALLGIAKVRTATIKASSLCVVQLLHSEVMGEALETFPQERVKLEKVAEMRRRVLESIVNKDPEVDPDGARENEMEQGAKGRAKLRLQQALEQHMDRYRKETEFQTEFVDPCLEVKCQLVTEREAQTIQDWLERRQKMIDAKKKKLQEERTQRPVPKLKGYRDFEEAGQEQRASAKERATASSIRRLQTTYRGSCRPKDWIPTEWPPREPWDMPAVAGFTSQLAKSPRAARQARSDPSPRGHDLKVQANQPGLGNFLVSTT